MTLYTFYTNIGGLPEYTKNTRSCTMTYTGHDRRLYTQYRPRPTTLYTSYTIMRGSSEYTKNTQSCNVTNTGHDRWLYKRLTQLLGLRSAGVGILIRRPRPCFVHRPDYSSVFTYGLGPTYYNSPVYIRTIYGCITLAYRARYEILVLSWLCEYTESYMKYTL